MGVSKNYGSPFLEPLSVLGKGRRNVVLATPELVEAFLTVFVGLGFREAFGIHLGVYGLGFGV